MVQPPIQAITLLSIYHKPIKRVSEKKLQCAVPSSQPSHALLRNFKQASFMPTKAHLYTPRTKPQPFSPNLDVIRLHPRVDVALPHRLLSHPISCNPPPPPLRATYPHFCCSLSLPLLSIVSCYLSLSCNFPQLVQIPPAGCWLLWGSGCWGPLTPRQKQ